MVGKEDLMSEISILSGSDVDPKLLEDYYKVIYPGRNLPGVWQWLYNISFHNNRFPLVLFYRDKVIAHCGMIPFYVIYNGRKYTGSWYVDFSVLPEYRGQGLGQLLTKEYMKSSDICLALGAKRSIEVFRRLGWSETDDAYLHYLFLRPFNHPHFVKVPSFLKVIGNILFRPYYSYVYSKLSSSLNKVTLIKIDNNSIDDLLFNSYNISDIFIPIRDKEYFNWRILNSPHRDSYFIYRLEGIDKTKFLIRLNNNEKIKYIDIMLIIGIRRINDLLVMISTLSKWGMKNGYSYMRIHISDENTSTEVRNKLRSIVRNPKFAFFLKDEELLSEFKKGKWEWEFIDSDYERF